MSSLGPGSTAVPAVSVIICTRNRAASLAECLSAITGAARAMPAAIELVVVDNGSTDDTADVVAAFARTAPFPVSRVEEKHPGLARARNVGIGHARGRLLLFTDDDCLLSPDYFTGMLAHYAADAEPVVRGGRIDLHDPEDLPVTIKTDPRRRRFSKDMHPGGFVHGCNMTMDRAVIDRVGPFDERFGAGTTFLAGEDTDLLYRAHRAGIAVEYVPDMVVSHKHGRRTEADQRALFRHYDIGNGAFYAKFMFKDHLVLRYPYWDLLTWIRAVRGQVKLEPENMDYAERLRFNLLGMARFWFSATVGRLRGHRHGGAFS